MKLLLIIPLFLFVLSMSLLFSCSTSKENQIGQKAFSDSQLSDKSYVISAPIVVKKFVNKAGRTTDHVEYYIQQSIQDYFIKFCESAVTENALKEQLNRIQGDPKTLRLIVEKKNGSWDICDDDFEVQSRIGDYMIITKIIE